MVSFRTTDNILHVIGDISIASGDAFRRILLQERYETIDLALVERWDTSSFQLLISLLKHREHKPAMQSMPERMREDASILGIVNLLTEANHGKDSSNR